MKTRGNDELAVKAMDRANNARSMVLARDPRFTDLSALVAQVLSALAQTNATQQVQADALSAVSTNLAPSPPLSPRTRPLTPPPRRS